MPVSAKKKSHHGGSLKSCASRASHAPLYHPFALYTQYANTALPYAVRLCELKGKSFTGDERAVARGSERSATSERALQLRCLSLLHMCIHASHAHMQHAHCTCDMHMARHSSDESRITHEKRERTPTLSLTRFLRLEYSGPPRLFWRGSLAWRPCPHRGHRGCPRSRRRSRAPQFYNSVHKDSCVGTAVVSLWQLKCVARRQQQSAHRSPGRSSSQY